MTSTTLAKSPTDGLISTDLRHRLTAQLIREHDAMTADEAVRIVDQTVAYLKTCVDNPGAHFRPSKRVDLGWHMFILNTRDYVDFCQRVAGSFIHHVPDEFSPGNTSAETTAVLAPTLTAMRASGFEPDADLWAAASSACTQCHSGCTNCGQGEDPH